MPEAVLQDEALYNRGTELLAQGEWLAAAECFREVAELEWSDRRDRARYRLGESYLALAERGDTLFEVAYFDTARIAFDSVDPSSERGADAGQKGAAVLYRQGDIADSLGAPSADSLLLEAQSRAQQTLALWPHSVRTADLQLLLGHVARKRNQRTSALFWYETVIAQQAASTAYDNALYWAGDLYWDYRFDEGQRALCTDRLTRYVAYKQEHLDTLGENYLKALERLGKLGVTP